MTRTLTLGLAALAVAGLVVVALWCGLGTASEEATAVVPQGVASQPVAVVTEDELTAAAPDVPLAGEQGDEVDGDRIETPDPLEAAVAYLGRANPHLYASLTSIQARQLTEIHLGGASVTDSDVAELRKLPALQSISVSGATMESLGKLLALRSDRVEIRNQGTEVLVYLSR